VLVDHDAPEPPYLQVAAIMRERIQSGSCRRVREYRPSPT
jgi:hypothetical protein